MEKKTVLSGSIPTMRKAECSTFRISTLYAGCIRRIAGFYSRQAGEAFSIRQTKLMLNAQSAFMAAAFPADFDLAVRFLLVGVFAATLLKCRRDWHKDCAAGGRA